MAANFAACRRKSCISVLERHAEKRVTTSSGSLRCILMAMEREVSVRGNCPIGAGMDGPGPTLENLRVHVFRRPSSVCTARTPSSRSCRSKYQPCQDCRRRLLKVGVDFIQEQGRDASAGQIWKMMTH